MHSELPACPQPLLVRSLQLVEVRPYAEEEEEEEEVILLMIFAVFDVSVIEHGSYFPSARTEK